MAGTVNESSGEAQIRPSKRSSQIRRVTEFSRSLSRNLRISESLAADSAPTENLFKAATRAPNESAKWAKVRLAFNGGPNGFIS